MISINTKSQRYYDVACLKVPCEGPRCLPLTLDFSVDPAFSINLQNTQALIKFSMVQAVFIDNSNNGNSIIVSNPFTDQSLIVPANSQAYLNILCPTPAQINFQSQGGVVVKVELLNYPVTNYVWKTT